MDGRILKEKYSVLFIGILFLLTAAFGQGISRSSYEDAVEMVQEEVMTKRFNFSEPRLDSYGDRHVLTIEGEAHTTRLWEPRLPMITERVLIPHGRKVVDVEAEFYDVELVAQDIDLYRTDVAILSEDHSMSEERELQRSLYEKRYIYPENKIGFHTGVYRGYTILTMTLIPFEYHTEKGELWNFNSADVNIYMEEMDEIPITYRGLERDREYIKRMVDGGLSENLDTYPVDGETGDVDYLLITTSDLLPGFQPLVDHKEARGVSVIVELISDIENDHTGIDTQEKIRNCIIDHYINSGITYVNLAGDTTDSEGNPIVPHRGLYADCSSVGGSTDEVPSDYYYGGLDGCWDANENRVYGEWDDDPDWYMDVWVGRLPAQNPSEAEAMVNKIISWEETPCTEQHYSHGENDVGNIGDFKRNKVDNTQFSDAVHDIIPSNWNINADFESEVGSITPDMYIEGITGGSSGGNPPMFVNHGGHGSVDGYNLGGGRFNRGHADSMINDFYPIHATPACTSGSFDGRDNNQGSYSSDRDCLAESLLKNPAGGMVATFMNTRWGLGTTDGCTGYSGALDTNLYHGIFTQGYLNLGTAAQWARMDFITEQLSGAGDDELSRWSVQAMNYLGCPEMPVLEDGSTQIELESDGDGWNFISIDTLPHDRSMENVLSSIDGDYDRVLSYESPYVEDYEVVWNETFDTDEGWTFSGGEWEIDEPQGLGGSSGNPDPEEAYVGTQVLGYDLTNDGDYEANIPDTYWATSPTIDMADARGAIIDFQRWLNVGWGVDKDYASIEVYDGYKWHQIWENSYSVLDDSWNLVSFDVSHYADGNSDFRFRFGMGPTNSGFVETRYSGWNVDDIRLKSMIHVPCQEASTWSSFIPDRGSRFNTLSHIDRSDGIWIRVTRDTTLDITGYRPSRTTIRLKPGWNMVGYPSETSNDAEELLPEEVTKIGIYDPSYEYNLRYSVDLEEVQMEPGGAYWVYNDSGYVVDWILYR